jgi:CRISPR type I-A-associated protein Csa5
MSREEFEGIIRALTYLVKERVYGPVDRMARAVDVDTVRLALYEAVRYVSVDARRGVAEAKRSLPDENEVRSFLERVERDIGIAKKVAAIALTRGVRYAIEAEAKQGRG